MIPITKPVSGHEELEAIRAVLESGYLVQGPRVAEFEAAVAAWSGSSHAIAVSNCTVALRASLLAIGVGPGDVVAVAPYSWVATANAIEMCGATPLFVDVDAETFNMSPDRLADAIDGARRHSMTGRLKAVLPVHTFGNTAGIDQIVALAATNGLAVIEDAACAIGATAGGRPAGSLGVAGCYSFHPRKVITTGEGGMVVTDDDDVASFLRSYRNHGQAMVDGAVEFIRPGDNLRLTEMQAAMGTVQMRRLADVVAARARGAEKYDAAMAALGCTPQRRDPGAVVQSYVVVVPDGVLAVDVVGRLRAVGVEATIGTNAIPFVRWYEQAYGLRVADLPATARLMERAVTLPLFPSMVDGQFDEVVAALEASVR